MLAKQRDRRRLRLPDEIISAGQYYGGRSRARHRRCAVFVGMFEMVGRKRAEARRQRRAVQIGELIGVKLHRQPERARRLEDARDFLGRERDAFAEAVDGVDQPFAGEGRQDRRHDRLDIAGLVAREFGRQGVGAEKGSSDRCWPFAADASGGEQRFALVRQIEAVAGFDLDRRDAFADQRVETRQALADEFVLARRAQGFDRGNDAAAGARDLFIARAAQPHLEFAGAVSRVDEVRVAIDQARRDPAAVTSDRFFRVA